MDALALRAREFPVSGDPGRAVIRVAHVSDMHVRASALRNGRLAPVYEALGKRVRDARPDIILITGDTVDGKEGLEAAGAALALFGDSVPKYAVMGNHDYSVGVDAMRELYAARGCVLLVNAYADVRSGAATARVYGADDLLRGAFLPPVAGELGEGLALILCHEPGFMDRIGEDIRSRAITYAFSGHTHGGQATFFGIPLVLPEESGGYVNGEYRIGEIRFFVSRGVGTSRIDLRFFARPDFILVLCGI
jgi:uncharacterized protein